MKMSLKEDFKEGCRKLDGEIEDSETRVVCEKDGRKLGLVKGILFEKMADERGEGFERGIFQGKHGKGSISQVKSARFVARDNSLTVWGGEGGRGDHVKLYGDEEVK